MLPAPLKRMIQLLSRLPGVGEKTAQRFALHLVTEPGLSEQLGSALSALGSSVQPCEHCGNLAELAADGNATCVVCRDSRRDASVLCVVSRVQDLLAIERSGVMRGRYFVLGRLLSPLDGIGPEELPMRELSERLEADAVTEVILATPASVDGEATALFLARELRDRGVNVSRIASGIPHGGELEFADQITLGRAITGRRPINDS